MLTKEAIVKAKTILHQLEAQLGQTIGFGCLLPHTGFGVVLAAVDGSSCVGFHIKEQHQFALHTSAPGKAIMAYLPPEQRADYYAHMDFVQHTPNTISNRTDFEAEIASVLKHGYSVDIAEKNAGVHCIGAPVFDPTQHAIAALWVTGPASLLPLHHFESIANTLKNGSQEITRRMYSTARSTNRNYIHSVIEQAKNILQSHGNRSVDVRQIAENLCVSYSWFREIFKEQTGLAPAEYHQKIRIEKSQELLRETELTIRMISEELGFKTQNHFSALFKRKTGQSPLNYRMNGPS